jgi:hypothetical protein
MLRFIPMLAVVALAGCAGGAQPIESPVPGDGTVLSVTATVIDDGSGAELCAIVLESYPPQCGAPVPLVGWDWTGLDLVQEAEGVRWGVFTVVGEYDGERMTLTETPAPAESWPEGVPSHTGDLSTVELTAIQRDLERDLPDAIGNAAADGFVHVTVWFDDGSLQAELDDRYGEGAVVVSSLLRPVA